MKRRVAAAVGAVVIIVLLFIGIKGCLGAQKDQEFKDFAKAANQRVHDSNVTTKQFFTALSSPKGSDSLDLQTKVNTSRVDAEQQVKLAKSSEPPDELSKTKDWLVQTLEFRSEAISKIADQLDSALGSDRQKSRQALDRIATEMQGFVASDVIFQARAKPDFSSAFDGRNIEGTLISSQTPPSLNPQWLTAQYVADALAGSAGDGSNAKADDGLSHGTGLGAVTIGGTELVEGDVNRLSAAGATMEVQVENQGAEGADESQVPVTVTIKGAGNPITKSATIPSIVAGESGTAKIPLGTVPTDGVSDVSVDVGAVPGEETTDNNKASYQVSFTK